MNTTGFISHIPEFLSFLEDDQNKSVHTASNYKRYLFRFETFCRKVGIHSISDETFKTYDHWLVDEFSHSNKNARIALKTVNYHLSALRSYLRYLRVMNIWVFDYRKVHLHEISRVRVTKKLKKQELHTLLSSPSGRDIKSLRDRAILLVLAYTDLRVSELTSLDRSMLSEGGETLTVYKKNGLYTEYNLPITVQSILMDYLDLRSDTEEALFANNGKRSSKSGETRLTPRSIERIVRYYKEREGLEVHVTPHVLRISGNDI